VDEFIVFNYSNLHYITSNDPIGKLVEEVGVPQDKKIPSICLDRQSEKGKGALDRPLRPKGE
jgi:hypothetical protein